MKKLLLLLFITTALYGQDQPFNCDYNAYLFQYNDVYAIDLASGNSYAVATDVTEGSINAAAYNPADGFIWGSLSSPSKSIVRIGKDFSTVVFYVDELPTSGRYIGDISANGVYYLKGGGTTYYSIDVDPESENYGQHIATLTLPQSISIHDWAFNAVDGMLYTVEKGTNILYRINIDTGAMTNLGEVPILSGLNYTYGAVYFDADGRFYVSANQTGTIYVIQNVQDLTGSNIMESNLFAFGPSSSQNDGARCPTAPVPQEDCSNGIDDDGDGLIDCEDPSCSGYAGCPVIEASTSSSANEGGLESNNRLSELVNKRNFNRAKRSYNFDKTTAKRFKKTSKYGKNLSGKGNTLQLSDFIPLDVISEDEAIESSPQDLIGITNATEIYSVDYIKNSEAVASILLLKTEDGVYEHSKYICDRLLGAELISVSTIEIKGQQFIRSLIRNVYGNLEFVLSFSAKAVDNDTNFEIESHWNIDKYEDNVGFYNFQIWTNSLDNLVKLGEEVVTLLEVQKPVINYNNSSAPTVFIKSGKYRNGKLDLLIVNTNRTENIVFDGGVRTTETGTVEMVSTNITLDGHYISNVEVDAGSLFDVGFRIGDGVNIPDDLFLSDGPWGYDDAQANVTRFDVATNSESFQEDVYQVERNIALEATTDDYVAVYRALTPKFNPIDLSAYNSLKLKASGTGTLIVRLVKESISDWEAQFKTSITLTEDMEEYTLPFSDFIDQGGAALQANDVTSIVYTMLAENGETQTKILDLEHVHFASSSLSVEDIENTGIEILATPNPMHLSTSIQFNAPATETFDVEVYNQLGHLVKTIEVKAVRGNNNVTLKRGSLSSGIYFCKLESKLTHYKTIKLVLD
ncbi:DUF6923 family protein [Hyunsoonleella pacifica]|uniref:T9SS type A sorting domain-containing protein n=1 Tax=Hyunsoonleella pacifica TaxID=1080224 RepID=A0A4Q9FQE1_9FLAO|nr:T9SS type A sorting domain-containing protein [Hyunsoonleella pacifica]TBN17473.1 T9SS type A sorting domain-containing protein [Hyunsoonleella pacifica]GGD11706.1 hypothetical protein GCM10011368_12100 [Hyunsoonleella pacifica]